MDLKSESINLQGVPEKWKY